LLLSPHFTNSSSAGALAANDRIVDLWSSQIGFLGHVSANKSIRDECTKQETRLSKFDVEQSVPATRRPSTALTAPRQR
jgi:hypothetical protein